MERKGHIYVYTGTGAGKTIDRSNALGLALRSVGHRKKVVIIQFMKWWKNLGEYKIRSMLEPYYEIYQFRRKGWIGLSNFRQEDKRLAEKGLKFAEKIVKEKKPQLLVLDEINLAVHCGLLDKRDVLAFLDRVSKKTDVVLTGRYSPKEFAERADFVNEVIDIKSPKQMVTKRGMQY